MFVATSEGKFGTVFERLSAELLHEVGSSTKRLKICSTKIIENVAMRTLNNRTRFYQQPRLMAHAIRVEQGFAGTGVPAAFADDEYIEAVDAWE